MAPYSVVKIAFEPTDETVSTKALAEKKVPQINLAINKTVTASSDDISVEGKDPKNHDIVWGSDKLTDGYRLQLTEIEVFDNSYEDISILDGVSCISDGSSIITDKEVSVLKAVYDKNGVLEAVNIENGTQFDIKNISAQTVVYVWINEMQRVTEPIKIKE